MDAFADNLRRLLGLHAIRASSEGAELIGVSAQALSELQTGKRRPSLKTVHKVAQFFEIPIDRLIEHPFEDLLAQELADPKRYKRVEAKRGTAKNE